MGYIKTLTEEQGLQACINCIKYAHDRYLKDKSIKELLEIIDCGAQAAKFASGLINIKLEEENG